jgi:hypothetical protein
LVAAYFPGYNTEEALQEFIPTECLKLISELKAWDIE